MTDRPVRTDCPSEEELAVEAVGACHHRPVSPAIQVHLAGCPACQRLISECIAETKRIVAVLEAAIATPQSACVPAEDMALYLDRQLTEDASAQVEHHLSECPKCRKEISDLYREVEDLVAGQIGDELALGATFAALGSANNEKGESSSQIKPPAESGPAFYADDDVGVSEPLKKRYSSESS